MGTDPSTKTVTTAGAPARGAGREALALSWVFPLPGQPPIALDRVAAGAAELSIGRDAVVRRPSGRERRLASARRAAVDRTQHPGGPARPRQPQRHPDQRAARRARGHRARRRRPGGRLDRHRHDPPRPPDGDRTWPVRRRRARRGGGASATGRDERSAHRARGGNRHRQGGRSRAIHAWSGRPGPFVAVNCAALPETLAEAELFGYRRGAFTGADKASAGYFRSAEGGTLLLDEVSDLPLPLQAKLLRVLEQREVHPLGETRPVPIDVRIVVAGQVPLLEAARAGRFRADLVGRLDGLTVRLPPLRDRRRTSRRCFRSFCAAAWRDRSRPWTAICRAALPSRLAVQRARAAPAGAAPARAARERDHAARGAPAERIGQQAAPPRADTTAAQGAPRAPPRAAAPRDAAAEPLDVPALVAALRAAGGNVTRARRCSASPASAPTG